MTIAELAKLVDAARPGRTVVYCHGCYDLLHVGHVRHLQEAAALGDILVVTVTPDRFVNKGPDRPLVSQDDRLEMVMALRCVHAAAINEWPTAVEAIERLRPNLYVKGHEFTLNKTAGLLIEEAALAAVGGSIAYTSPSALSTTGIVEAIRSTRCDGLRNV